MLLIQCFYMEHFFHIYILFRKYPTTAMDVNDNTIHDTRSMFLLSFMELHRFIYFNNTNLFFNCCLG